MTKYHAIALKQMREGSSDDLKYLFEIWIRTKANPSQYQSKQLIKEFWSLVLFETYGIAAAKVQKWLCDSIPENLRPSWVYSSI